MKYIEQFFDQLKSELDDALLKGEKLLKFLRLNPSIWGIAHIPVNLELICSLWSNEDWSETKELTITSLYTMITTWLCRRYLASQNVRFQELFEDEVYQRCRIEMVFLESLAFNAMKSNTIILRPSLLKKTLNEVKISLHEHPHLLNVGVLKSFNRQGIGTQIEVEKDYYFLHLSFQEYFAARYMINALKGPSFEDVIEFIKYQKYNQRYALVFSFVAGLLSEGDETVCLNTFWDRILQEPLDLVGLRHLELIILCLEETSGKFNFTRRHRLLEWAADCIKHSILTKNKIVQQHLSQSLRRAPSIVCAEAMMNMLIVLLECDKTDVKIEVLFFICCLNISNASVRLISSIRTLLTDSNEQVITYACEAVRTIGAKAETVEVVDTLVRLLKHNSNSVRGSASYTLGHIDGRTMTPEIVNNLLDIFENEDIIRGGAFFVLQSIIDKVATTEVINRLANTLKSTNPNAQHNISELLRIKAERIATNEMIDKMTNLLEDERLDVLFNVCQILTAIGKKAETSVVINKLVSRVLNDTNSRIEQFACITLTNMSNEAIETEILPILLCALKDTSFRMRLNACSALSVVGQKVATVEAISALRHAMEDENEHVRACARIALTNVKIKLEPSETMSILSNALSDENESVRSSACRAIVNIDRRAPKTEVINMVETALRDKSSQVKYHACISLCSMGEAGATTNIIDALIDATEDENEQIRAVACEAFGRIGQKSATTQVIGKIMSLLDDQSVAVRASACYALQEMGDKAMTIKAITKLANALKDQNICVRERACRALCQWSGKRTIDEIIDNLVDALGDESMSVRHFASTALENMISQTHTRQMIGKLTNALESESEHARERGCFLLGRMKEKAATTEMIEKLMNAIHDQHFSVRSRAWWALGQMTEQIEPTVIIDQVVNALLDKNCNVTTSAWFVLQKISDKIRPSELITKLIVPLNGDNRIDSHNVAKMIGNKLNSSHIVSELGSKKILNLCLSKFESICLKNVSEEQLIDLFSNDKVSDWPSAITKLTLIRKTAVTFSNGKIVVYGRKEPLELFISEVEYQQLEKAFIDQGKIVNSLQSSNYYSSISKHLLAFAISAIRLLTYK